MPNKLPNPIEVLGVTLCEPLSDGERSELACKKLAAAILLRALRDAYSKAHTCPPHERRAAEIWILDTDTPNHLSEGVLCRTCCEALGLDHHELIQSLYNHSEKSKAIHLNLQKNSKKRLSWKQNVKSLHFRKNVIK